MRLLRKLLIGSVAVVVVFAAVVGGLLYSALGHLQPLIDGQVVSPGVTLVRDGMCKSG